MSTTRINHEYSVGQFEIAADYIAQHHVTVIHPEDRGLPFFDRYAKIEEKLNAMSAEEKAARIMREEKYKAAFKVALVNYFSNTPCRGMMSDYAVNCTVSDALKGHHCVLDGGFWSVTFQKDGKVYSSSGKYGAAKEIQSESKNTLTPGM